jgi:uncharacterized delta-60 repeat protein
MAKSNFSSSAIFGEELSPGVRVGGARFILKRLLGRGETSEVWLAQDVKGSRPVAMKFLPAALLSDANLVEKLKQDAARHRLLAHLNIAATYEFVRDYSSAAIVTEFVDGWSLATLKVDKLCGCYRIEEIGPWMRQLCAALDFAHNEFGIVHSDLKPANLLINAQEELKITDFALAQTVRMESSRRGLAKGIYGGLGFMSPQQVMGAEPSQADDIYSLGATIFDLLTGTPPFHKGEIFAQICSLKPPSMTERITELEIQDSPISPVWEDTVARCLAKNPAERPQSVKEVLQLLERSDMPKRVELKIKTKSPAAEPVAESSEQPGPAADGETKTATDNPPDVEAAPLVAPVAPRKKTGLMVAATVIAILVLAAGVFIATNRKQMPSGITPRAAAGQSALLDKNFNPGTGADGEVRCVAVQPDGKILLGGKFSFFNGVAHKSIVRLNSDGSIDESFKLQGNGAVHTIALQGDGKVLIGGDGMEPGHGNRRILRLNPNGSLDKNFKFAVNYNGTVRAILVQPDGKILVGGDFNRIVNQNQNRLVRLNADGTQDNSFNIGGGASGIVSGLALQPDGKILALGKFAKFDNRPVGGIVRLLPNGGVDEIFHCTGGDKVEVYAAKVLADGKILVGGNFTTFNGTAINRIARLNFDGTVDASFNPNSGLDDEIIGLDVQPDGKIVIGGSFRTVEGTPRNHVARLSADGRLDKDMNPGTGTDQIIWRVAVQPDGKTLLVGAFGNFDGVRCGGVVRLLK